MILKKIYFIDNGFEFFGNKDLVSINSIPYNSDLDNKIYRAIMLVNNDSSYSFKIFV